jgi:hypothetical protein
MFAVTPSASTFDYRRWLDEDQILTLNGDLPANEIDKLMEKIQMLHRQAYRYERNISHINVSQGVRECLDRGLINLRQTIRLATEIYDLCYAYSDYSESQAVEEIQRSLIGS